MKDSKTGKLHLASKEKAEEPSKEGRTTLLEASLLFNESLQIFYDITSKAAITSQSAAIEGARMRSRLPAFAIVANHVHAQSLRNAELLERLRDLVKLVSRVAIRSTAVRYYEIAEDLIDKIDRNLFERNCDVQAWATYDSVLSYSRQGQILDREGAKQAVKEQAGSAATSTLEQLVTTYIVYFDSLLVNCNGTIIASAKSPHLVGENIASHEAFQKSLQGAVHVGNASLSTLHNKFSVTYSAPLMGEGNQALGVLINYFNWDYAQEMIDSANLEANVKAYYIDAESQVLASVRRVGVGRDYLDWLDAAANTQHGHCGFGIERERNGSPIVVGFAKTKGYNAYRGKKWAAIVSCRADVEAVKNESVVIDTRTDALPLGSLDRKIKPQIESEMANIALAETMVKIEQLVSEVNHNNREARMLAINASIQSGIAGAEGEGFAIIAEEIGRLAAKSLGFVRQINNVAANLRTAVETTRENRLEDAARDTIDKVDRNLFERFCDVQAWTVFEQFQGLLNRQTTVEEVNALLERLHKIYEVYHDVYLVDQQGRIVASAINRGLIGTEQGNREWFQSAMRGSVYFSDVYFSDTLKKPTVAFSCPIFDKSRNCVGVLTTRFNCNFLNDILKAAIVDSTSRVYVVNRGGLVIGAPTTEKVLTQSFQGSSVFSELSKNKVGHCRAEDKATKKTLSYGFALGKGYNSYPGLGWAAIVERTGDSASQQVTEEVPNKKAA